MFKPGGILNHTWQLDNVHSNCSGQSLTTELCSWQTYGSMETESCRIAEIDDHAAMYSAEQTTRDHRKGATDWNVNEIM